MFSYGLDALSLVSPSAVEVDFLKRLWESYNEELFLKLLETSVLILDKCGSTLRIVTYPIRRLLTSLNFLVIGLRIASLGEMYVCPLLCASEILRASSGCCNSVEALNIWSIAPVSSAKVICFVSLLATSLGDGGRGTFDGDLVGEGMFEERSLRGCLAVVEEALIVVCMLSALRNRTCWGRLRLVVFSEVCMMGQSSTVYLC